MVHKTYAPCNKLFQIYEYTQCSCISRPRAGSIQTADDLSTSSSERVVRNEKRYVMPQNESATNREKRTLNVTPTVCGAPVDNGRDDTVSSQAIDKMQELQHTRKDADWGRSDLSDSQQEYEVLGRSRMDQIPTEDNSSSTGRSMAPHFKVMCLGRDQINATNRSIESADAIYESLHPTNSGKVITLTIPAPPTEPAPVPPGVFGKINHQVDSDMTQCRRSEHHYSDVDITKLDPFSEVAPPGLPPQRQKPLTSQDLLHGQEHRSSYQTILYQKDYEQKQTTEVQLIKETPNRHKVVFSLPEDEIQSLDAVLPTKQKVVFNLSHDDTKSLDAVSQDSSIPDAPPLPPVINQNTKTFPKSKKSQFLAGDCKRSKSSNDLVDQATDPEEEEDKNISPKIAAIRNMLDLRHIFKGHQMRIEEAVKRGEISSLSMPQLESSATSVQPKNNLGSGASITAAPNELSNTQAVYYCKQSETKEGVNYVLNERPPLPLTSAPSHHTTTHQRDNSGSSGSDTPEKGFGVDCTEGKYGVLLLLF